MISETTIQPAEPSKFLKKLCHHFSLKIPARYDTERGHAEFVMGVCEMEVQGESLYLKASAESEDALETVKGIVGSHIELFGKRENIKVTWK